MTDERYEMLWDCAACGTKGLLGVTHRHCPACGAAQDPSRRYFPPEDARVAVGAHPYHGADILCRACDTPNAAIAEFCVNCGSALAGATSVRTRADVLEGATDDAKAALAEVAARKAAEREAALAAHAAASGAPAPEVTPPGKRSGAWKVFAGIALVAAIVCGVLNLKKDAAIEVVGHAWERTVAVEQFGPKQESAWADEVPLGARDRVCSREVRSTNRVADGEDCVTKQKDLGDGSFKTEQECTTRYREEPVYDQKCRYTIDAWQVVDTAKAEGAAQSPAPIWPTVAESGAGRGARRAGARSETYTLRVKLPDGKQDSCTVPEARWSIAPVGSRWKAQVGTVTGALDCDALEAL